MAMERVDFSSMERRGQAAGNGGSRTRGRGQRDEDWTPASVYMNLGKTITVPGEDGPERVFVSLFGIGVDNQAEIQPYTGKSDKMRRIINAKIKMQRKLLAVLESIEAGDAIPVNGLELEMRRVGVAQDVDDMDFEDLDEELDDISFG